jgi:uncharacterized membrane protein
MQTHPPNPFLRIARILFGIAQAVGGRRLVGMIAMVLIKRAMNEFIRDLKQSLRQQIQDGKFTAPPEPPQRPEAPLPQPRPRKATQKAPPRPGIRPARDRPEKPPHNPTDEPGETQASPAPRPPRPQWANPPSLRKASPHRERRFKKSARSGYALGTG